MTTDQLVQLIAQLGFPIFVAAYLLLRMDGVLSRLTDAINRICEQDKNKTT